MNDVVKLGAVSLRQVRAFAGVADTGSFTAAASCLGLTQSAVSMLVRELETELGLKLFDRNTRSVRLTEAGAELLPAAQRVINDLQLALTRSREIAMNRRGRVRIAATPLFASLFLPKVILEYRRKFPEIDVAIYDRPHGAIADLVETGEVDLGVGTVPESDRALLWEEVLKDEIVLICPPRHALLKQKTVKWSDLHRYPYIATSRDNGTRQLADAYMAAAGVSLRPAYEVISIWTVIGMVSAGLGIGLTTGQVQWLSSLHNFGVRKIAGRNIERQIVLIRHQSRSLSPAAERFRETIDAIMNQ